MTATLPQVALKPDFAQSAARFEAWWNCELIDRPPANIYAHNPNPRPYQGPVSHHASLRQRWMDVEFAVDQAIANLLRHEFLGDCLPMYYPNIGPELTGTLLGCGLEFGEITSWSQPIIHDVKQWEQVLERPADFSNPYWQAIEKMTDLALEKSQGRFLVGIADLHGNMDILASLREPQLLCMDLVDEPKLMARLALRAADVYVAAFERLYAKVRAAGMGSSTWAAMYHQGPAYLPNCDFWCMISPEMAGQVVVPALVREQDPLERSLFHLDGPQALQHLDKVLALPGLSGVQWVYGAGNGPARRWIDVYRRIRQAGKCVQLIAETVDDALAVVEAVGPAGLWICIGKAFDSAAAGEAFLKKLKQMC